MQQVLIESMILPPIPVVSAIVKHSGLILEAHENFQKKSFRNRFYIAGPNGRQMFSVPLIKGKHEQQSIQEVRISYDEAWNLSLLKSIRSYYGSAPFFEYLFDDLEAIFSKKSKFLFDLNLSLYSWLGEHLDIFATVTKSMEYQGQNQLSEAVTDLRGCYTPTTGFWNCASSVSYVQVFAGRYSFIPHLSILDMLMCLGPETQHRLSA